MDATDSVQLSRLARSAIARRDWQTLERAASVLYQRQPHDPESLFLAGVLARARGQTEDAIRHFESGLQRAPERYDLAVELASQLSLVARHADAFQLLEPLLPALANSPFYSDLAATILVELGLPERALPLAETAHSLQPDVDLFAGNLANCCSYVGRNQQAAELYEALLQKAPNNRRNHYFLSRVRKATDDHHIKQMEALLSQDPAPEERNIFLFFALGKELEDLGRWDAAFHAYDRGCRAVRKVAPDGLVVELNKLRQAAGMRIERATEADPDSESTRRQRPIFIVGLPRTGSTLTERILSSHSDVISLGETRYFERALQSVFGSVSEAISQMPNCSPDQVTAVAAHFRNSAAFRLGDCQFFIDKLPLNFMFAPAIARVFPEALFVYTGRRAEAACFSMFKQLFTGEYLFSYDLADIGAYYLEHERYRAQFAMDLGPRWVEVSYERLVAQPETEIPMLLDQLRLPMEAACLQPQKNFSASMTASAAQVREPIHQSAVEAWRYFDSHLGPLKLALGVDSRE